MPTATPRATPPDHAPSPDRSKSASYWPGVCVSALPVTFELL